MSRDRKRESFWKRILKGWGSVFFRFAVCFFRSIWEGLKAWGKNWINGIHNLKEDLGNKDLEAWSGFLFWLSFILIFILGGIL